MSDRAEADIVVRTPSGPARVRLDEYVSADAAERAETTANGWIKALRHARVDGTAFRDRFEVRGDSLWWFAELYLHKRRIIARALRAHAAMARVLGEYAPDAIDVVSRDPVAALVASSVASAGRVAAAATGRPRSARQRLKAVFHTATALADRLRPMARARVPSGGGIAVFLHSAFWRRDRAEESYLGPIIAELERQAPGRVRLVGVGPRTNFRARRWRDRLREFGDPRARALPFVPIEALSGWAALADSRAVWRARHDTRRALCASTDIREHAVVEGVDLWPLVEQELAGIAELQFPWSARAMDEAAAALDALQPDAVLTYAEAGGWGRALMLEARRRGIPTAGMQHGFIYRHWLNYLHEPDEMQPSRGRPSDAGFPRPTRTLLFDALAAEHLVGQGAFPPGGLAVVGSPRLEAFVAAAVRLDDADRAAVLRNAGVEDGGTAVLVAAKHAQLGPWFRHLVDAAADIAGVTIVVKPHPAETAGPYLADAAGSSRVRVAPPGADLAALTTAARVLVTVHSTAAIEAMAIGVPALVLGRPTNLSPFVDAGAMAGVSDPRELAPALERLLRDPAARERLAEKQRQFIERYHIVQPPGAARRAAEAVRGLAVH